MRGIGEGEPLLSWLRTVGEEAVALTPDRAYAAAAAAATEALRSGTTTLVDHMWPNPSAEIHDAVLRALHDSGIRAVLCRGSADRADPSRKWGFDPRLMQQLDSALAHTDELVDATAGSRVSAGLAVPNPRRDGVVAGARADLVLHRFERDYACLPVRDPGTTLLTCASSRTVDTVLVAGEAVVWDGRSARLSEAFLVDLLSR